MRNLSLMLTLGLFCFASTLLEKRATAISKSDFRLSVSSTAYPGNRDKDVVATITLKETWKKSVQATKQSTSTSATRSRKDKKVAITMVKNKPLISLSKSHASQTKKKVVSNILSTEKIAGNPSSDSWPSCSYCASFTKNIHDVKFSFNIPSSAITPEITSATSLFSGFISSRSFLKDGIYSSTISQTPNLDNDPRETFTRSISLKSFGNNFVSQVLTSQLPLRTSILVEEIRDFSKHDTSISDHGGNKMFTKGSDSVTELPSNVLSSTIWKRLNLISKVSSRPNVARQISTTTVSFNNTFVVRTLQTAIKSSFAGISQKNEMTVPSSVVTDPINSSSSRQSSSFSGNSRIFSSVMASPPVVPNIKEPFDTRTTGVTSATPVPNKNGSRTKMMESPSNSGSELNAEVVKSSLKSPTTSQRSLQVTPVGESVPTRLSKHSSIQKDTSNASVAKSHEFNSLNSYTSKPQVISETLRLSTTIKETSSLTGSFKTRIFSTRTSEADKEVSVNNKRFISLTKLSPTAMALQPPNSTLASSKGPAISANFSTPVSGIVTKAKSRTKLVEWSVPQGNSRDMTFQRSVNSMEPSRTVDYFTQSSGDISWTMSDTRTDLSSKQLKRNSPYSQTKSYQQPSCSEYTTKFPTQGLPSVAVTGPVSGNLEASVISQTKSDTSKLKVFPPRELLTSQKPMPIEVTVQSPPTETSSATVVRNMSSENLPTTVSDNSASHVKLLIVVAIVPSVILCAIFGAAILFRRNRNRRNTPVYSIKVEYLDEKKFRKRCVNSRLDLSLKGIHIDLEYSSSASERRNSYPRDIALFSRGSNLGEMQMRDLDLQLRKQHDDADLEWRNGVIVRVRETSLNSRSQPTVRDSIYSVKEKENFEPNEKVVRRESSKRGRESVTWRIPVVQRRDSEDFDQRCSVCTDDTALFPEEPAEKHEVNKSNRKYSGKTVQTNGQEDKAFAKHENGNNPINLDKDPLRVQLPNKKMDEQINQVNKENKLTVELNSRKKERSQRSISPPRCKFGTL